jgi:hypothetical protein
MKKEAKYYLKNKANYGYIVRTMYSSEYKHEYITITDEKKRQWHFSNKYCKKTNCLINTEWKCVYDTFEKKGIIQKKLK